MMYFPMMVFLVCVGGLVLLYCQLYSDDDLSPAEEWARLVSEAREETVDMATAVAKERRVGCHFYNSDCFDVYRCGRSNGRLKVYIYPPVEFLSHSGDPIAPMSMEFEAMLESLYTSDYYTSDPEEACIFVPSIDLLHSRSLKPGLVGRVLNSLKYWGHGRNHLLFNMVYSDSNPLPTDQAIMASSDYGHLRPGYDLAIPIISPLEQPKPPSKRPYLLSYQQVLEPSLQKILSKSPSHLLLSIPPDLPKYLHVLGKATFCLVTLPSNPITHLTDCMAIGSIPVIITPSPPSLPFSQLIDWVEISIQFRPASASSIVPTLQALSPTHLQAMQSALHAAYTAHLSSPARVMLSTLAILDRTVFSGSNHSPPPPANPVLAPPNQGFTALILTYNRVESLFQVITKVSQVESLTRVVVVWNHQTIPPPPVEEWPRISKPLKVIQTSANKLSNRFYPYSEIETECVLSLDDDISMLTSDELEFGYQVWREFPDRIVGFPSRTHIYDNTSDQFRYESEWTNDLSMVLTGVSFYHKYWHYLYTAAPTTEQKTIKDWVDKHINCEDIAFNIMVANATGKAPIKVGPRKKFKCSTPSCENAGMLSAATSHLEERSSCLDSFIKIYGHNPLKSVQFRADPVLYKDSFPDSLKMFKDIGSL
eukprot:TRINITY_DN8055_c0_g1_i5.p1 TRINITY_DN8055_c0_g1~~TRINITY_DN8055_c0_g1_i5.p1  ORF type:complete len:650 (-),score=220.36 TRINITY_DN8055_c0_g1_i5:129-2078(-)